MRAKKRGRFLVGLFARGNAFSPNPEQALVVFLARPLWLTSGVTRSAMLQTTCDSCHVVGFWIEVRLRLFRLRLRRRRSSPQVNLPAAQLQVAMGLPLHMIPDIRRMYGRDPYGTDHIDFNSGERGAGVRRWGQERLFIAASIVELGVREGGREVPVLIVGRSLLFCSVLFCSRSCSARALLAFARYLGGRSCLA